MLKQTLFGIFIIAETTFQGVPSGRLGEVLVTLAALMIIVNIGFAMFDRLRGGTAQKREVTLSAEYASQEDLARVEREVAKIDGERRTSVAALHAKIDANTTATAALGGELKHLNQQLQQVITKMLK